jgi:hypothetical protein
MFGRLKPATDAVEFGILKFFQFRTTAIPALAGEDSEARRRDRDVCADEGSGLDEIPAARAATGNGY